MGRFCFLSVIALLIIISCNGENQGEQGEQTSTTQAVSVPSFNRDSAYSYVDQQVAFGPRVPGTTAHEQCRDWLTSQLKKYTNEVQIQKFTGRVQDQTYPGSNIIARFNPKNNKRVLLAAHWDSRHVGDQDPDESRRDEPILGADDGASGVGVLLEIARQLHDNPIELGVDIVFFDVEDQGVSGNDNSWGLGAQEWSRKVKQKAQYGILLDMVGSPGATFSKEGFSLQYARNVVERVWSLAQRMGYSGYFKNSQLPQVIDDHYFVNQIAKIPMIDIIHRDQVGRFGRCWHTHCDDMTNINRGTLKAVGQVVLAVVYNENNGTLPL